MNTANFLYESNAWQSFSYMEQIDGKVSHLIVVYSRSEEIRRLLDAFLKIWKYRVLEAATENDLIGIVKQTYPSAILFDLSLMLDDELELLRRLRETELSEKTPILVLSGHARHADSMLALESGASEYFVKPLNFELLEHSLKKYSADNLAAKDNFGGWQ